MGLILLLLSACGGGSGTAPPSALSYSTPDVYPVGTPISAISPKVTGTVASYSVSPALPAGLSLDSKSGQISGTPTTPSPAADYSVTATNDAGSVTFKLSVTVITVDVVPGSVARMVVPGTAVNVIVAAVPVNFSFSGTLHASATDSSGVFDPAVDVLRSGDSYNLAMTVSTTAPTGHHAGTVTVKLCQDSACAQPEAVPSAQVAYAIDVLDANSAWLGNNLTALAPWTGVADWTMFQGNAAHTGYVPVTLDPNQFSTRWQIPAFPAGESSYIHMPATAGGQLFVSAGKVLYARKESDGSVLWQHDFSGLQFPSVNPPSVANGVVYVAAGQQSSTYMFAFAAADGTQVFQSQMSSQWENYLAPTVGALGVYTNAGTYGGMYAFAPAGQQLFFTPMGQTSEWTPAVDANHVYGYTNGEPGTGGNGGGLTVLDPGSGTVQAFISDPTFVNAGYVIQGAAVIGAPGSVIAANYSAAPNSYPGSTGNTLLDFNVALNSVAWKIAGAYPSTPAYNAGVIYAANDNPLRLEARSETDGTLLWSWQPGGSDVRFVSEVLLTQNMAFVSTDLAVYGVDLGSHLAVWSYPLSGRVSLSQNGILYIEGASPLTAINVK